MSDEGFHVHGPHEPHDGGHGDALSQRVALFTAVLATLGAYISYESGLTQNEAMMFKNDAVLKKAEASDVWAQYQSKSMKAHLSELALELAPSGQQEKHTAELSRYREEMARYKAQAEALDQASKAANEESARVMQPHHRMAEGMTLLQVAISLASITALTRRRWLFVAALGAAVGGVGLFVSALF
jgi:hypothetical protein